MEYLVTGLVCQDIRIGSTKPIRFLPPPRYKALICIRKEHRSLSEGEFIQVSQLPSRPTCQSYPISPHLFLLQLYAHGDYYGFARFEEYGDKGVVVVVLNRGSHAKDLNIPLWKVGIVGDANVRSLLPDERRPKTNIEDGVLHLHVEAYSSYVFAVNSVGGYGYGAAA